jgi:hypothetical protein
VPDRLGIKVALPAILVTRELIHQTFERGNPKSTAELATAKALDQKDLDME